MAIAAVSDEALGLGQGVVEVLGLVHGQDGAQLLVRELLGGVDRGNLADKNLGAGRHRHAGDLGDLGGALAHDLGVHGAVDNDGLANLVQLVALEEVAATGLELGLGSLVGLVANDGHGLLGRADHAVVKGLGVNDGVDGQAHVSGVVDDDGGVAGADAQGGLARGVGGLDHAGTTGGQDDVGGAHELVGQLQRRRGDPVDDALGRAGLDGGVKHELGRGDGAVLGARVGRDQDRVARLKAQKALVDGRGRGVGRGDDRRHDAHGLGDLLEAKRVILLDDVAGLHALVLVVDVLGGVVVLDDLVLHDTHAGLGDRHLGQRNARLVGRHRRLIEDLVNLLLGEGGELRLRCAHTCDALLQRLHAVDGLGCLCHVASLGQDLCPLSKLAYAAIELILPSGSVRIIVRSLIVPPATCNLSTYCWSSCDAAQVRPRAWLNVYPQV